MDGGAYLTSGRDTCIYKPEVACVPGTLSNPVPDGSYVSRLVSHHTQYSDERVVQPAVKAKINALSAKLQNDKIAIGYLGGRPLKSYVNLAVASCTPDFKQEDLINKTLGKGCELHDVKTPGRRDDLTNFITPNQDEDVSVRLQRPGNEKATLLELRKVFHVAAYLNDAGIVHADAHFGNLAWMGDRIVMHDWGSAVMSVGELQNFIKRWNLHTSDGRDEMDVFVQFLMPCILIENCSIVPGNKQRVERLMKMYDIASMLGGLATYELISPETLKSFQQGLEFILNGDSSVLGEPMDLSLGNLVNVIHEEIDELFDSVDRVDKNATPTSISPIGEANALTPVSLTSKVGGVRNRKLSQGRRFCKCIKTAKKTVRALPGVTPERGAIAVCVKSVLQTRGRTIKRFKCGKKPRVLTQRLLRRE